MRIVLVNKITWVRRNFIIREFKEGKILDIEKLKDIKDITVNTRLPKEQRIADYINQIRNPYIFKYDKAIVHISFSDNGDTLEEILKKCIQAHDST